MLLNIVFKRYIYYIYINYIIIKSIIFFLLFGHLDIEQIIPRNFNLYSKENMLVFNFFVFFMLVFSLNIFKYDFFYKE